MSNACSKEGCAQMMPMLMPTLTPTTHDGQSMIVQGSLVDKPNEPKIMTFLLQDFLINFLYSFVQTCSCFLNLVLLVLLNGSHKHYMEPTTEFHPSMQNGIEAHCTINALESKILYVRRDRYMRNQNL